ncbi:unnamed protein product [Spirodela intermedia]|uniref:Ankyrin repeat domain-containing protein n=1 Tax=Spirodela intermedia TaxID=51605 RepID=A0A7I8LML5_SPIIN|nr:unnamed protein product [Spirodela intermedia]
MEDLSRYAHSPAHLAVAGRDHASLRRIVAALPRLPQAGEVATREESIAAEHTADVVSAAIDRRDVPGRETPLHLTVRLRDPVSAEILMSAGADWTLQNERGWSAFQEAVCTGEDAIARIIARHCHPLSWAKWCRRLPLIVSSVAAIRDFYMEISFHFESSVIPFIGRIAPSDTYRIWKQGSNVRADTTLAGFDGFCIQRSDQTFLFFGEGLPSEDGWDRPSAAATGSLLLLAHREKEITDTLRGAGAQPTEMEVAQEIASMFQTNMYRPGIDVTQAELVPHLNWRRQERTEMVGPWKAKVYDMLRVVMSVKSRKVPGAPTEEELIAAATDEEMTSYDGLDDILTTEERKQLDSALKAEDLEDADENEDHGTCGGDAGAFGFDNHNCESSGVSEERRSWFSWSCKKAPKNRADELDDARTSKLSLENGGEKLEMVESDTEKANTQKTKKKMMMMTKKKKEKEKEKKKKKKSASPDDPYKHESEYKKGLRPSLWLTPDFPLQTEELLPLLDVLANKVKAIRRLRELLTTKLPQGTFPVKVAIPIVPTIRVVVTFTKFEQLQPRSELLTPESSPADSSECRTSEAGTSSSWYSWIGGSHGGQSSEDGRDRSWKDEVDPFRIPSDYTWVDADETKQRMSGKKAKPKKASSNCHATKTVETQKLENGFDGLD